MPKTKNFRVLREQVESRTGARRRVAVEKEILLAEIRQLESEVYSEGEQERY